MCAGLGIKESGTSAKIWSDACACIDGVAKEQAGCYCLLFSDGERAMGQPMTCSSSCGRMCGRGGKGEGACGSVLTLFK